MDERIKKSRKQEKRGAKAIGGKRHGGSGSGWSKKNDAHTETELIEYKRTDNTKSIRILDVDLVGVALHADLEGKVPLLGFELNGRNYFIVREPDWIERGMSD